MCVCAQVPTFYFSAMENWGLIAYRPQALLLQPGGYTVNQLERVAQVVAHELAHQWFGNLVTAAWWTDSQTTIQQSRGSTHITRFPSRQLHSISCPACMCRSLAERGLCQLRAIHWYGVGRAGAGCSRSVPADGGECGDGVRHQRQRSSRRRPQRSQRQLRCGHTLATHAS